LKIFAVFSLILILFSFGARADTPLTVNGESMEAFKQSSSDVVRRLPDELRPAFITAVLQINVYLNTRASFLSYEKGTDRKDELSRLLLENVHNRSYTDIIDFAMRILEDRKSANDKELAEMDRLMAKINPSQNLVRFERGAADCSGVTYTVTNNLADSTLSVVYFIAGHDQIQGESENNVREFELSCRLKDPADYGKSSLAFCDYPKLLKDRCLNLKSLDNIKGYYENFYDSSFYLKGYTKGYTSYHLLEKEYARIAEDNDMIVRKISLLKGTEVNKNE
jgi:hypothetical protein